MMKMLDQVKDYAKVGHVLITSIARFPCVITAMYHELFLQGRPDLVEGILKVGKTKSPPGQQLPSPSLGAAALVKQQYDDLKATVGASLCPSAPVPITVINAGRASLFQRKEQYATGGWMQANHINSNGLINLLSMKSSNGEAGEDELPEIEDTSNLLDMQWASQGSLANFVANLDDFLGFEQAPEDNLWDDPEESSDQLLSELVEPTPLAAGSFWSSHHSFQRFAGQPSTCPSQAARDY
jgi:hypothetical protein